MIIDIIGAGRQASVKIDTIPPHCNSLNNYIVVDILHILIP